MRTATGLRAWVVQRVSAIYLAIFLVYAVAALLLAPPVGYAEWRAWLGAPAMGVATLLFFVALLLHVWVGLRDILIDYVPLTALRVTLLSAVGFGLVACGLWAAQILFMARL
jgi:succinate dehydrogenase / fumarate reductase membrane anchor subunit